MPNRIVHSYSSLKCFTGCPKQYWHQYVAKDVKREFSNTGPAAEGKKLHAAIENASKFNETRLPKRYAHVEWLLTYYQAIYSWLKKMAGHDQLRMYFEYQIGMDKDFKSVGFFDRDVYYRGMLDMAAVCAPYAYIGDLKTGNPNYADDTQLEQQAVLLFAEHPEVKVIVAELMFTQLGPDGKHPRCYFYRDDVPNGKEGKRVDLDELEDLLEIGTSRVDRLIATNDITQFVPQQNGLCKKFCDVLVCSYNGKSN